MEHDPDCTGDLGDAPGTAAEVTQRREGHLEARVGLLDAVAHRCVQPVDAVLGLAQRHGDDLLAAAASTVDRAGAGHLVGADQPVGFTVVAQVGQGETRHDRTVSEGIQRLRQALMGAGAGDVVLAAEAHL